MKELIKQIAESLVDQPENVNVRENLSGRTKVYELQVAKPDLGKVIGKQGRNADAIRTILTAIGGKTKTRVLLDVVE